MSFLLSDQARLLVLILSCAALWSLESAIPLFTYVKSRARRALPNIALAILLVLSNLVLSLSTLGAVSFAAANRVGLFFLFPMPDWLLALAGIMALDLFTYFAHLLLHKSWLGWQFHRVHHSDNEVNVTTTFRQHPGETVWRVAWYVLAIIVFGIPMWVVVVYLALSTLNAQLEHSNIRFSDSLDRALRQLFVTPHMHKVHHSRLQPETDTNYSNIFSMWDRIFRTYTSRIDFKKLRYGLDGFDGLEKQTLPALLRLPFSRNA